MSGLSRSMAIPAGAGAVVAALAVDQRLQLSHDAWLAMKLVPILVGGKLRMGRDSYSIADLWQESVQRFGDRTFTIFEHRRLSFQDFEHISNQMAHFLLKQGLKTGQVCALMMENKPEYVCWWLAMAKIGVQAAMLNFNLTGKGLAHCIAVAGCGTLVFDAGTEANLHTIDSQIRETGLQLVCWGGKPHLSFSNTPAVVDYDQLMGFPYQGSNFVDLRKGIKFTDVFGYIYTSGTTGLPKAAKVTHARMYGLGGIGRLLGLGPGDVLYTCLPLYHTAGGGLGAMSCFMSGATMALAKKFSAARFWREISEQQCTAFQYIGELGRYLVNYARDHPEVCEIPHKLRGAIGNGLRPEVWDEFQDKFNIPVVVEFYGATEGNGALVNVCRKSDLQQRGAVGRSGFGFDLITGFKIVKFDVENETPVRGANGFCMEAAMDEPGELLFPIREDHPSKRFDGYTDPKATEKKVLRDVFKKGDSWFRSGDLLYKDAKGLWHFVDRTGDTFRWKGENVSTMEVSQVLSSLPGVEEANVYGVQVPGEADGRACMVALRGQDLQSREKLDALQSLCEKELPSYARPRFLRFLSDMDITGTFKHQKVLAAEGFGGHGGGRSAWPPLLKRQLLGAKDEPEVAATQVLEPLLPLGEMPSLGRFLPSTADEKQLALLARALGTAAVLRPELCARLLREDHRAIWIASAESASAETQVEVLRFIRMSCEVVGRGAVAWWLKEEGTKLLTLLRRSVLSPLKGKGSSNFEALCAVEALRCWITFLRCGAGCDRVESFAAEIGTYWHRFAVQHFEGDVMESHFLLTAHLLELTLEVFRLREVQEVEEPVAPLQSLHAGIASAVSSAFCAASPVLAKRLTRVENTSSAQQLCLATFTDVLDVAVSAAMAAQRLEGVDSPLRPAKQLLAAQADEPLPEVEVCGDEAAPWPLGGAYKTSSLAALARLRALGALARLGGKLLPGETKDWLQALRRRAIEAVQRRAPKLPLPAATEALVGDVTGDPISALLIDVCLACQEPLSSDDFGQALAISGSWPTAQALFRHAGLNFGEGEDAIVRAAFQPHAVWSEDAPEALGPPSLALAAAPFWALATADASCCGGIRELLKPLVTPEASDLAKAVPPWLPFVTFASLLGHSKAWRDETCRELLERYVDRHLRSSPSWKDYLSQEWISELMRGLCDRLAKIFLEESFMDTLLASTLWSFSACFMPPACRAVCWGEDATLLRFLDRALACESSRLLWQLEDYAAPEGAASRLEKTNARTWPRAIAARSAGAGGLHTMQEKLDLDSLE